LGVREVSIDTNSDGEFVLSSADFPDCCFDPLVVTDGRSTLTVELPVLEIVRVDPGLDVIAGNSAPNQEVHVRILGTDPFETSVSSASGAWMLNVADEYDILPGMTVEVWVESPDMTVTYSSGALIRPWLGLRPGVDEIGLGGFQPLSPVTIVVDGVELPTEVFTDASGEHSVALAQ
jgi:hypothetical protein